MSDYKLGDYTLAQCCKDCDYANNPYHYKVDICPDCGGDVEMTRGRWKSIEVKNSWLFVILGMGNIERTEKHHVAFLKKSDDIGVQKYLDEALSHPLTYTTSDEDKQWLNMSPVGKEYGSATFDDDDNKAGDWRAVRVLNVVLGQHGPKIHMHASAGDPEDIWWQAAAILVLAGYKGAIGFGVERDGDGRYYLIPETTDPRGIKSYVMPFAYTEEGFEQFATIERYIRDPANRFGLWETAESHFTMPENLLGLNFNGDRIYQWRQQILQECLQVMADRYYD